MTRLKIQNPKLKMNRFEFCALGFEFSKTEPCPVAGYVLIPNPIRWASGNPEREEDVGLGDLKTERSMC